MAGHVGFLGGQGISADITGCVDLPEFLTWSCEPFETWIFMDSFWRTSVLCIFCVDID